VLRCQTVVTPQYDDHACRTAESRRPTEGTKARARYFSVHGSLAILTAILGGRTGVEFIQYVLNSGEVKRYEVESAALWFVLFAATSLFLNAARPDTHRVDTPRVPIWSWLLWCAVTFALFSPALTIGFLSDDFVLADRAGHFDFGFVNPDFFRPVPLALWAVALSTGLAALVLHAANLLLHATNAFLAMRWSSPLLRNRVAGMLVGTTVLTMPAAVEPVVWCSGIFDVMVTTFVLLSLLAARRYETEGVKPRITLFTWIVAALLTKETAVVAPLLILLDAWSRQVQTRRLYKDLSLLLVATTVIGVLRLFRASEAVRQPITKYMVQRWAFGTIGGLAVPWHVAFIRQYAVISALVVVALLGLITCLSAATVDSHARRVAISTATWPLICTAPALTFFYVSADLQNSRYLYLATIGWAGLLLTAAIATRRRRLRVMLLGVIASIAAWWIIAVRGELGAWQQAAAVRDAVEQEVRVKVAQSNCRSVAVLNAPDSIDGAYVFRNGLTEALRREVGVSLAVTDGPNCTVVWHK